MPRLLVVGSLGYHDETILEPIVNEAAIRGWDMLWLHPEREGALVHIPEFTEKTMKYWNVLTEEFCKNVRDGDLVLVADFWNPRIFDMKFWAARKNLKVYFFTIHHGSSDLPGDFAAEPGYEFCHSAERSWFRNYDGVFFGSYHTYYQCKGYLNFYPTYLPISAIQNLAARVIPEPNRTPNTVVMPLRMDPDKGVDEFLEFAAKNDQYTFICFGKNSENVPKNVVVNQPVNREELLRIESGCEYVVSFARQETFGYAVFEAVYMGCKPLIPWDPKTVYHELYSDKEHFLTKIGRPEKRMLDIMKRIYEIDAL